MTSKRIGIFGGSFDPVHYGHLLLAESCREQCSLDQVWFVPAAVPPHKQERHLAEGRHRVEMLKLAVAGNESFDVSTMEIDREGVSFTVETLQQIRDKNADADLFFLLGSDTLNDLPNWREPARICKLATLCTVHRADGPQENFASLESFASRDRIELFRQHMVEMPEMGISSRELRKRIANGGSVRFQMPRAVEMYIETHGLYRE